MLEFLHGALYAVCVELKNFYLFCFGCLLFRMEVCVMGICGGSRDVEVVFGLECRECGAGGEGEGVLEGWTDVGVVGGEWAR